MESIAYPNKEFGESICTSSYIGDYHNEKLVYALPEQNNTILKVDPKVRFAGICDDSGEIKYGGQERNRGNKIYSRL
jgi:hypothetical protein